jgi:predicted transcriptional regulator
MKQEELDAVLQVIENPVRRRIIKRLSRGSSYALQLSKELGLGQPLVAKHLSIMEDAGMVTSVEESKNPSGGKRKWYSLAKSVTITMDLAPNLFMERAVAFAAIPAKKKTSSLRVDLLGKRVEEAMEMQDDRGRLSAISEILDEVDKRMREVEGERVDLLSLRNAAMTGATKVAEKLENLDKKRILFHILDEHDKEVESISRSLNLRETVVRSLLDELEREVFG